MAPGSSRSRHTYLGPKSQHELVLDDHSERDEWEDGSHDQSHLPVVGEGNGVGSDHGAQVLAQHACQVCDCAADDRGIRCQAAGNRTTGVLVPVKPTNFLQRMDRG